MTTKGETMAGDPLPNWIQGQWMAMPSPWPYVPQRDFYALLILGMLKGHPDYRDARVDDTCDDAVQFADELIISLRGRPDA